MKVLRFLNYRSLQKAQFQDDQLGDNSRQKMKTGHVIHNPRYDVATSRPSIRWKAPASEIVFPFDAIQLLEHIRKEIDAINNERLEHVHYSNVRGVYLYGSCVFRTNAKDSDYDLFLISDDLSSCNAKEGGFSKNMQYLLHTCIRIGDLDYVIEINMMNTKYFMEKVVTHLPIILLMVQQPDSRFVLFEDVKMRMWRENWNRWNLKIIRAKNSYAHELHICKNKSKRFWNGLQEGKFKTELQQKDALKKVKKNLAHGLRYCKYSYQIVFGGSIYDYSETNTFYDMFVYDTDNFTTWDEYYKLAKPLYDQWEATMKEDFKNITKHAIRKCLECVNEDGLSVVQFLNRHCRKQLEGSTFDIDFASICSEEDPYALQFGFGPYSLSRMLSVNVSPVLHTEQLVSNPNMATLYKFDVDNVYQCLENGDNFYQLMIYQECNGLIVKMESDGKGGITYAPICVPRFYLEDFRTLERRFGNDFSIKIEDYSIYENPRGINCELYFYNDGWMFSFGNDYNRWLYEWMLSKEFVNSTQKEFLDLWHQLEMKYPCGERDKNINFFFTYQPWNQKIIYKGCRDLCALKELDNWMDYAVCYDWKEVVKPLQLFSTNTIPAILEIINNTTLYSPIDFVGVHCINFKNQQHSFQIQTSIHLCIPRLRISHSSYMSSTLDADVIENPPESLTYSAFNLEQILYAIAQTERSSNSTVDELAVKEINPVFLQYYKRTKGRYAHLCYEVDTFYANKLKHLENDNKSFRDTCRKFLNQNTDKVGGLFFNLRKRSKLYPENFNVESYWRSTTHLFPSEIPFIQHLLEILYSGGALVNTGITTVECINFK